jgi:hypothetical protein
MNLDNRVPAPAALRHRLYSSKYDELCCFYDRQVCKAEYSRNDMYSLRLGRVAYGFCSHA